MYTHTHTHTQESFQLGALHLNARLVYVHSVRQDCELKFKSLALTSPAKAAKLTETSLL